MSPKVAISLSLLFSLCLSAVAAGEQQIVLREYLNQSWSNELLTYPFSAPPGACQVDSVTLTGPRGPVPVQLSEVELWPGTETVKSAKLSFIADLAPLATHTYLVRYGQPPSADETPATDLKVAPTQDQVEITTTQFGARLLLGKRTYAEPVAAAEVPAPIVALRLADGTWFGGSEMYGPAKITAYSATLTDSGPVFTRVLVRYTYANGNTMDVSLRVAAGDNTVRCETKVAQHQPDDGFRWVLSRGLPPLIFQVQDEVRRDREVFLEPAAGYNRLAWADLPLQDYVAPKGQPAGLVTNLSPWEDWFSTFTQTRIRLRLENTERELQLRSLDAGAWVQPKAIEAIFDPAVAADPAADPWVGRDAKLLPLLRAASGEVFLQVNAAQGLRKWTVSECLSLPGVAALFQWHDYKPESTFPPETRPTVGYRLDEVKDYVLDWPAEGGGHPRLFITRPELEALWQRKQPDPELLETLQGPATVRSAEFLGYMPNSATSLAVGAYLLSGWSPEVAARTFILDRLRQALNYELWGMQFASAGAPAPILYDAVIDSPAVPEQERSLLRAQMAYYGYRLADPAVWSAERGYASGNQNMTVTWEISRGLVACVIPDHPMAKVWYAKAERIMEQFLDRMVGPAGEWPEAMGAHGRASLDMILAFAVASTSSGLHDYVNDPRTKRLVLWWAKMLTPRDPRPRGHQRYGTPDRRYFPAMGRDCVGGPGATCGVMARVTRDSYPEYSAALQWAWLEEGASDEMAHLGGFSYVACEWELPARTPDWASEVFPHAGAVLRHGLGTPDEHQVMLYSGDHFAAFYPGHTGSFPGIFAYGTPLAGSWPGSYWYQEGFLTCQVDLARPLGTLEERSAVYGYHGNARDANLWSWPDKDEPRARFGEHGGLGNVSAFSTLPRQDYAAVDVARHYPRSQTLDWRTDLPEWPPIPARGRPPVDWRRQVLFLKDDDPSQPGHYLLIRDSVTGPKGPQPTMWQMWTVSEKIGTPDEVRDLEAFLADKPGDAILPARELRGDSFTAIGQLGVDVEYYIAAPTDAPRYTLRWGTDMHDWANKLAQPEYQDLLHLQMPGDGAYFVAFYPRKRDWPAPVFSTLGEGLIIKVAGDFGTDYGFLSALEAAAVGEGASFRGTAASVQDRRDGLTLCLGAEGEVRYQEYGMAAAFPVSLRVREGALTVELPATIQPPAFDLAQPFAGGTVTLVAPGEWALAEPTAGVKLSRTPAGWELTAPGGVRSVALARRGG